MIRIEVCDNTLSFPSPLQSYWACSVSCSWFLIYLTLAALPVCLLFSFCHFRSVAPRSVVHHVAYHPHRTTLILTENLSSFSHVSVGKEVLNMLTTPCCPTSALSSLLTAIMLFSFTSIFLKSSYLYQISLTSWLCNEASFFTSVSHYWEINREPKTRITGFIRRKRPVRLSCKGRTATGAEMNMAFEGRNGKKCWLSVLSTCWLLV